MKYILIMTDGPIVFDIMNRIIQSKNTSIICKKAFKLKLDKKQYKMNRFTK